MPLRTFLDLSTAHLTEETRTWLEGLDWETEGPSGGPTAYGWFMYAHDDPSHYNRHGKPMPKNTPEGEYPSDLWAAFEHARALGASHIHFDCDGEVEEGLPLYEEVDA